MNLTDAERSRYSRHILLPEVGLAGQERLAASKVLLVGAGGLGCPAALYLAAAGVGTLGLVDFDVVDDSNLQRQVLYTTDSVGRPKTQEAKARLQALNPHIQVVEHREPLTSANAVDLIRQYDLVLDGTDNFPTRYLVNDASYLAGVPNVYGSIFRFEGQVSLFNHENGPCYRCIYRDPPPPGLVPSCAEGGVLGILPGVVGTLQATEAIKVLLGIGKTLRGRLLLYDALDMQFEELRLRKDPACLLCGPEPTITAPIDYEAFCNPIQAQAEAIPEITAGELVTLRAARPETVVLDVREPGEVEVCRIEGSLLIPLVDLPRRVEEIPRDRPVVVHCKVGGRSAKATRILRAAGIDATNLQGGIDAWRTNVQPELARY